MSDFWRETNVFVTGGTGLLGSWLTPRLVERGANVVCLVRDQTPRSLLVSSGAIEQAVIVHGAIEDYELVLRTLNEHEIEIVFHLAAQTIVPIAHRSPLSTFETNIKGTWCLLEAARNLKGRVRGILIASSDKAYGEQEQLPYHEDTPLRGIHPYDVSKSCADLISNTYVKSYGMPICITRCGNMYGGGDLNWNRLVPGTIRSFLHDESPLIRSDGTLQRDYVYVEDIADAYILLAENMERPEIAGRAFNFGNERPFSVLEVVETIRDLMGKSIAPTVLCEAGPDSEIPVQYLDSTRARALLDWTPRYSFREGLERTIPWYEQLLRDTNQPARKGE
ncbi:MAG TPA: GDP-mannose 4,6-dehydratase [Thermoanaerobaculia bacterium]|nr:GDP-mannose 4,6-dehydratase [Thermoanaerobaculia bacterium]